MSKLNYKNIFNKELKSAGSSGSADAAPRMTEQVGRSMVEMLGVLAVMGVLSVAGIAGYNNVMRQYKVNEIVNATSMLYMMGASQNQGAGDKQMLYSAALGTVPNGVFEITYNTDKTITITFNDTDLCPQVKNKLGDKAGKCTGGSLTITFGEEHIKENSINLSDTNRPQPQRCVESPIGFECDCTQGWKYLAYIESFCISTDTEPFVGKCFTPSEFNIIKEKVQKIDPACDCFESTGDIYICQV